ncbi:MAG: Flp pilus assembly complex ATPase component [Proteobacteria bacterium]|nr:Flp pilus assembly complex ATPase component [Pseudomonadota bacterium]MCP4919153.1 Flp pilus assembly complex ATPase component [Pseudomonadota bacterium]
MRYDRDLMLRLLRQARDGGATDLHLKVPGRPSIRVDGELIPVAQDKLTPADTRGAVQALMSLAGVEFPLARCQEHEFAFGVRNVGRFRVAVFRQRGSFGVIVHRMATDIPSLSRLGVPAEYAEIAHRPGLTLLSGSRRRELLAGLVDAANGREPGHIIVLEDSLEYLHSDRRAAISQREIGIDTATWMTGIHNARRQDPDLLVVGDVPDGLTAAGILSAVEGGRRVVASVAAAGPEEAVAWFIRLFGQDRENEVAGRLAAGLEGSMTLDQHGAYRLRLSHQVLECIRVGAPMPAMSLEAA